MSRVSSRCLLEIAIVNFLRSWWSKSPSWRSHRCLLERDIILLHALTKWANNWENWQNNIWFLMYKPAPHWTAHELLVLSGTHILTICFYTIYVFFTHVFFQQKAILYCCFLVLVHWTSKWLKTTKCQPFYTASSRLRQQEVLYTMSSQWRQMIPILLAGCHLLGTLHRLR